MDKLDVFTARDLRNNAGGLIRDAEDGRLALVTKHGRPVFIAVPFDASLVTQGVHRNLAVRLYQQQLVTLSQASKVADLAIEDFLEVLQEADIPVVDYPPGEIEGELENLK